jgi:hypothetical protein
MNKGERISHFVRSLECREADDVTGNDIRGNQFYRAFFRCWNKQQYYEAHDVLEHLWLQTKSEDAQYFKGLIQSAGAFVHLKKQFEHPTHPKHGRRLAPAVRLFRLAEKNLAPFTPLRHGLDVAKLRQLLNEYAHTILDSDHKINPWSPAKPPILQVEL